MTTKNYEERIKEWQDLVEELKDLEHVGILPSPPDPRDYTVEDMPVAAVELPKKYRLEPSPIILDQGQTGYCAGASGAGIANAYYNSHGLMPDRGFSMAFLYWLAKQHDGIPHVNGTYIRTVLKMMHSFGCAPEALAPYSPTQIQITPEAFKAAEQYKIEAYARLYTSHDIKKALTQGLYIIFGTLVTRDNWSKTYLSYPKGSLYGGHATHYFEFDDELQETHLGYYHGQNSWGKYRHDNGRFFLPYDYHNMTVNGRPAFLEAWGVKFYDVGDKKKEPMLPKPVVPPIVKPIVKPIIKPNMNNIEFIKELMRKRFEEMRKRFEEKLRKRLQR